MRKLVLLLALAISLTSDFAHAGFGIGKNSTRHWPKGIVPYAFSPRLDERARQAFVVAADEWAVRTANLVKFIAWSGQPDYVLVQPAEACLPSSPTAGKKGGQQDLFLGNASCNHQIPLVEHELGHVLGLLHEQSRPDRDEFIVVNLANREIIPGKERESLFQVAIIPEHENPEADPTRFGPYDVNSIMHYGSFTGTNGNGPVITLRTGGLIPNPQEISENDVKTIRAIYATAPPGPFDDYAFHGLSSQYLAGNYRAKGEIAVDTRGTPAYATYTANGVLLAAVSSYGLALMLTQSGPAAPVALMAWALRGFDSGAALITAIRDGRAPLVDATVARYSRIVITDRGHGDALIVFDEAGRAYVVAYVTSQALRRDRAKAVYDAVVAERDARAAVIQNQYARWNQLNDLANRGWGVFQGLQATAAQQKQIRDSYYASANQVFAQVPSYESVRASAERLRNYYASVGNAAAYWYWFTVEWNYMSARDNALEQGRGAIRTGAYYEGLRAYNEAVEQPPVMERIVNAQNERDRVWREGIVPGQAIVDALNAKRLPELWGLYVEAVNDVAALANPWAFITTGVVFDVDQVIMGWRYDGKVNAFRLSDYAAGGRWVWPL